MTTPLILLISFLMTISASASERDSVCAFDYYLEGVREYCAGNYEKSAKLLSECIKSDPENDAAYYYMAMTELTAEDIDQAMHYLDRAITLSPDNENYRVLLARMYTEIGEPELAIGIFKTLTEKNPGKSEYYYELIDLYVRNDNLDSALVSLDRIEQIRGRTELTCNARYEILSMKGEYAMAEDVLKRMDEDFPSARTSLMLGDIYKAAYNDSCALYYYDRAVALDPGFTPAYFGIAEIYRVRRDFQKFFSNIDKFLSSPDMNPSLKTQYLEEVVFASGMAAVFRPQTDTLVYHTLNAHPADTSVLTMAGLYSIATDSVDKGLELLRENIRLHPDVKSARTVYMGQLYSLQRWEGLIDAATETERAFPDDFMLKEFLAIAYWQKDQPGKAAGVYESILRQIPDDHPMLINCYAALGDLYHETGNRRKAYSYYEKGLRIDDNYSPILNNYAYFLSEEGRNLKKAVEMSRKTILNEPENSTYLDTYGWLMYLTGDYEEARKYLKKAMVYGGKESAVILDHYAEALFALKEYNLAFLYWSNAEKLDPDLGIGKKIIEKRKECGRQ